jgi:hypothetical protein
MALRGKAGDNAKGDFLGGMRSARPRGEAVLKPRDNMNTAGQTNGRWPNGAIPRWKQGVARGRAEPARPRGGKPTTDGLAGEGPEMTRKVVFSVGCALRVRVARPYVRRDVFIFTPWVDDDSAAKGGQRWSWRCAILVGVQSPPLRGVGYPS